ncbi:putative bifunctional diguanylate cyclase/phosphodiesterase [Salinicola aestuarinus]|uniref:putative bifunctional diguanylate cyclase/phosphodiesterase n=1 Tax=Salinicola aestuarinus TaxID=1949082 RepID=UPI000DA1A7DA|nr:EAL domain-containing protein [Salinicola aestuarinus]
MTMTDHLTPDTSTDGATSAAGGLLEQAVRSGSLAIALVDAQGTIVDATPAFIDLLPPEAVEAGGALRLDALFSPDDHRLAAGLASDGAGVLRIEHSGGPLALSLGSLQPVGRLVTLMPFLESPCIDKAVSDPLTGLGNRNALKQILAQWQAEADPEAERVVLMIDLDRFKQVNDTLGHPIGDDLLVHVAGRLERTLDGDGAVLRLGGDEMIVVYRDDDYPRQTERMAQAIVSRLARTFLIGGHQIDISASVGIACFDPEEGDTSRLLMHADLALYAAKTGGRNQYCFFEPHLESAAQARRDMEVRLRRALALEEFQLVYQPQISLSDGSISGFEALIRWVSEDHGVVLPAQFIGLAEEIGEIHAIGEWAIRTACREAAGWDAPYSVAVNVSPLQFEGGRLVTAVASALEESGLDPGRLELEITEEALIDKTREILEQLWTLREMGVCIAMDDFGTGYSSLGYLRNFPFSRLKIDQSFVGGAPDERSRTLVSAILVLANELDMTTIAGGVETEQQHQILTQSGCVRAQGHFFAPPMPPGAIAAYCAGVAKTVGAG